MKTIDFPDGVKEIAVKAGDVFRVCVSGIRCRNGLVHMRDETLTVVSPTIDTPFDEVGPHRINWIVRTKHDRSVWATLESCIARGLLEPVSL